MALPFYKMLSSKVRKILVIIIPFALFVSFINQSKRFYRHDITSQASDDSAALRHRLLWIHGGDVTLMPADQYQAMPGYGWKPPGLKKDPGVIGRVVMLKGGLSTILHDLPETTSKPLDGNFSSSPNTESRNSFSESEGTTRSITQTSFIVEGDESEIAPEIRTNENVKRDVKSSNTKRSKRTTPYPPTGVPIVIMPNLHQPTELCSREVKKDSEGVPNHDGTWFNFSLPGFRFYTYSAFYDDRPALLTDPVVRIISVSADYEKYVNETNTTGPFIYCGLHYDNVTVYVAAEIPPKPIGRGWRMFGIYLKEYIYTCPTISNQTDGEIPYAVRIISRPRDETVTACVPIEVPKKPKVRENLAICIQAAYGSGLDNYSLVEWFEFQSMLGVSHIGLYNLSLNSSYNPILKHYIKTGLVSIRNATYIQPRAWSESNKEFMIHGSPAINDCYYRNMHRFNYIAVIDFDEVILPKNHSTLPELLKYLDTIFSTRKNPPVNYVFYNQYYFLDLQPDIDQSPYLTFSRYRRRVVRSPYGYAVKSIINPRACVQVHNHYCWGSAPGYIKNASPEVIFPGLAVNQHYKKCHFDEKECSQLLSANVTVDDNILRYSSELRKRTQAKVFSIFGRNI